jgi:hypothetical protein
MLTECQNLVDNKMSELCGSTTECNVFASDELMGTGSLRGQKMSTGDYLLAGLLQFGRIESVMDGTNQNNEEAKGSVPGIFRINVQEYIDNLKKELADGKFNVIGKGTLTTTTSETKSLLQHMIETNQANMTNLSEANPTLRALLDSRIKTSTQSTQNFDSLAGGIIQAIEGELLNIQGQVNRVMDMIKTDPKISMCINGRDMKQIGGKSGRDHTEARFPNLLNSVSASVINSALAQATQNYNRRLQEEMQKMAASGGDEVANWKCIQMAEGKAVPSGKSDQFVSSIAIFMSASGITTQDLKSVSDRIKNSANGEMWTTWNAANRTCTVHNTSRVCKKQAYGFAYLKSKTVCSDPVEKTEELSF